MNSEIKNAIEIAQGTQTGAIVACAFGMFPDALPRFVGKASVTSDGFVMCSFVTRDGEGKHGAFVGGYSDLLRNAKGLADFVEMSREARDEFAKGLESWIGVSYMARRASFAESI